MHTRSKLPLAALALAVAALCFFLVNNDSPQEASQPDTTPAALAVDASDSVSETTASTSLAAWIDQNRDAGELDQAQLATAIALADQHRDHIVQLLRHDPAAALENALSFAEYHALPPEIQARVERPFSETADITLTAICDEDQHTPDISAHLTFADGSRADLPANNRHRFGLSKQNAPIQGIVLDGMAAIRPQVLQELADADLAWALENLPSANANPATDFLTGEPIGENSIVAIAGGHTLSFASRESLERLETTLAALDKKPGLDLGTPAFIRALASKGSSFNLQSFADSQDTLFFANAVETRSYLIIRIVFADLTEVPFTDPQELENLVANRVAPALAEYSYNKTTVSVDVSENVFEFGNVANYLNIDFMHSEAVDAYDAANPGNPASGYDHVSVIFPFINFVEGWAGKAILGGRNQWLNGRVSAETILHELGHNYGLAHANYWQHDSTDANSTDPVNPTGADEDYGDIFDVMGSGVVSTGHFHVAAKAKLGWIAPSQITTLNDASNNGTYRIFQFDKASATGKLALRIKKSNSPEYYWIGYKKLFPGIDRFDKGAYLIWQGDEPDNINFNKSWLVDTTPGSSDGKLDAGIALGQTYSDPAASLHITPVAVGENATGKYLDVRVNFGDFPGNQDPSGTLTVPATGQARSPVSLSYTGSDPDQDTLSYHWDFGDGSVDQNAAAFDHEFPVGGTYTITLTASDQKGGTDVQTSQIVVSDPILEVNTRASSTDVDLVALATNGTLVVAGGDDGVVAYSENGTDWTSGNSNGVNVRFAKIIWTGTEFLAAAHDYDFQIEDWEGLLLKSTDGMSWTREYETDASVGVWGFTNLAYSSQLDTLVLVRSDGKLEKRDSQGNWETIDLGLSTDTWQNVNTPASLVWTGSSFILGAYNFQQGAPIKLILQKSADGSNWEDIHTDSGMDDTTGMRNMAFINNTLLGSGFKTNLRYSLDDGDSWLTNSQGDIYRADVYAYGNGIYSAHGALDNPGVQGQPESGEEDTPKDFLSVDGRNWKAFDLPVPDVIYNDRIFFNNTFISVANGGIIHQTDTFDSVAPSPFDAWIIGYVDDEGSQTALANPDFDWAANFIEFALGSDPSDPNSAPVPPELTRDADNKLVVTIQRFAKTDVTIELEISEDLETWAPLGTIATIDTENSLELTSIAAYPTFSRVYIRIKLSQ